MLIVQNLATASRTSVCRRRPASPQKREASKDNLGFEIEARLIRPESVKPRQHPRRESDGVECAIIAIGKGRWKRIGRRGRDGDDSDDGDGERRRMEEL